MAIRVLEYGHDDIRAWLDSKGCTIWGEGFDLSQGDRAVEWFDAQLESFRNWMAAQEQEATACYPSCCDIDARGPECWSDVA